MSVDSILARGPSRCQGAGSKKPGELPPDPGLESLLASTTLSAAAKIVAVTLCKHWAWYRASCYPCNRSIAERCGYSPGHVGRALLELERTGWIKRELRPDGVRLIRLCWRVRAPVEGGSAPARRDGSAPARTKQVVSVTSEMEQSEPERPERSRPEATPAPIPGTTPTPTPALPVTTYTGDPTAAQDRPRTPARGAPEPEPAREAAPAPEPSTRPAKAIPGPATPTLTPEEKSRLDAMDPSVRDMILTWLMLGDPILMREARAKLVPPRPRPEAPQTLRDLLGNIRDDPSYPAKAADWLAATFDDRKSWAGYKARCEEAWRGELSVERLVTAYDQASGDKAKVPGAVFMTVVKRRE